MVEDNFDDIVLMGCKECGKAVMVFERSEQPTCENCYITNLELIEHEKRTALHNKRSKGILEGKWNCWSPDLEKDRKGSNDATKADRGSESSVKTKEQKVWSCK